MSMMPPRCGVIPSLISRRSIPFPSSFQRFLSTDKKESDDSEFQRKFRDQAPAYPSTTESSGEKKDVSNTAPELQRSLHSQYKERIQSSRVGRAADPSNGVKPTVSQKYFLVITRLFTSPSDIPEYVPNQTMKRMHDRMRVVTMLTAVAIVYIIAYSFEFRTGRQIVTDKASGKVVKTYSDIKS